MSAGALGDAVLVPAAQKAHSDATGCDLLNPESHRRSLNRAAASARQSGTPGLLRMPPVDAFEHVAQLRRPDRHHVIRRRRPDEPTALQPLGVEREPDPVVPEDLEQIAAATTRSSPLKHIQHPGEPNHSGPGPAAPRCIGKSELTHVPVVRKMLCASSAGDNDMGDLHQLIIKHGRTRARLKAILPVGQPESVKRISDYPFRQWMDRVSAWFHGQAGSRTPRSGRVEFDESYVLAIGIPPLSGGGPRAYPEVDRDRDASRAVEVEALSLVASSSTSLLRRPPDGSTP